MRKIAAEGEIKAPEKRPEEMAAKEKSACPNQKRKGAKERRLLTPEKKMSVFYSGEEWEASSSSSDRLMSLAPRRGEK